jgi:hypothetical protein
MAVVALAAACSTPRHQHSIAQGAGLPPVDLRIDDGTDSEPSCERPIRLDGSHASIELAAPSVLKVTILSSEGAKQGVAGATLALRAMGREKASHTEATDKSGRLSFTNLPTDSYVLDIYYYDSTITLSGIVVSARAGKSVSIRMSDGF